MACKTTSQSCPTDLPETITVTRQLAAAGDISDRHRLRAHEAVIRNRYGGRDGILEDLNLRPAVFLRRSAKGEALIERRVVT